MRRAFKEIIPGFVLDRRRKAYLVRTPLMLMRKRQSVITGLLNDSILGDLGLIDGPSIQRSLAKIASGSEPMWWMGIVKASSLELWLRNSRRVSLSFTPPTVSRELGELTDPGRASESYLS